MLKTLQKLIALCLLLFFTAVSIPSLKAQQDPQFTNYMFNRLLFNPAFAGTNEKRICVSAIHHNQWSQFEGPKQEGSPTTTGFSVHAPMQKYISGVGLTLINDEQGFENTFSMNLSVSYSFDLDIGRLFGGIGIGFIQKGYDGDWEYPENPNDPVISDEPIQDIIPDFSFGAYLVHDDYYAGLSMTHLFNSQFEWENEGSYAKHRNLYFTAGYNIPLPNNPEIVFVPSTLIKSDFASTQFDINVNAWYQEFLYAGLSYRQTDAVALLVGGRFADFHLGYSYDIITSDISGFSRGTHEFVLGYCFRFDPKVRPQNIFYTPRYL